MKKIKIGRILNSHGKKQKVKVDINISENDFIRVVDLNEVYLEDKKIHIENLSFYKGKALISFDDIDDNIAGKALFSNRDIFGEETIIADLIGLKVFLSIEGEQYGNIVSIIAGNKYDIAEVSVVNKKETELYLLKDDIFPIIDYDKGFAVLSKPEIEMVAPD